MRIGKWNFHATSLDKGYKKRLLAPLIQICFLEPRRSAPLHWLLPRNFVVLLYSTFQWFSLPHAPLSATEYPVSTSYWKAFGIEGGERESTGHSLPHLQSLLDLRLKPTTFGIQVRLSIRPRLPPPPFSLTMGFSYRDFLIRATL